VVGWIRGGNLEIHAIEGEKSPKYAIAKGASRPYGRIEGDSKTRGVTMNRKCDRKFWWTLFIVTVAAFVIGGEPAAA